MITKPVPASSAVGIELEKGDRFRVVNCDGGQVGDLFAVRRDDTEELLGMPQTRTFYRRLNVTIGDTLLSNRHNAMLTVTADTTSGTHDSLLPACSPGRYKSLGGSAEHPNCEQNYADALAALTRGTVAAAVHQPLNCFQATNLTESGELLSVPSDAQTEQYIEFEAQLPLLVVVSACPMDISPINGGTSKSLRIDVLEGDVG